MKWRKPNTDVIELFYHVFEQGASWMTPRPATRFKNKPSLSQQQPLLSSASLASFVLFFCYFIYFFVCYLVLAILFFF